MQRKPNCINEQSATLICINQLCNKQNPFICGAGHKCQQDHTDCLKLQWILFTKALKKNTQIINPIFKLLCDKVEKLIEKGIQQFKKEMSSFKQWKNQYGVVEEIVKFYECIQSNKECTLTGKEMYHLRNNKKTKFDNMKLNDETIKLTMRQIEMKRLELMNMIQDSYQNPIKIKHKYLSDVNVKLKKLQEKPEFMEIKIVDNLSYQAYD